MAEELEGPDVVAEMIYDINAFIADDQSGTTDEDLAAYRERTKTFLGELIVRLEDESNYQQELEDQIDELANELAKKDNAINVLTQQAKEAIEECKFQAEEVAEEMLSKVASEVNQRMDVERLLRRLQSENARLQTELVSFRVTGAGTDGDASKSGAQVVEIHDLRLQLKEARAASENHKMQRDAEMFAVTSVIETLEGRIGQMRSIFRKLSQQTQVLQSENSALRKELGVGSAQNAPSSSAMEELLPSSTAAAAEILDTGTATTADDEEEGEPEPESSAVEVEVEEEEEMKPSYSAAAVAVGEGDGDTVAAATAAAATGSASAAIES